MYCWGKAQQGALGLGGIEDLSICVPKWNKYLSLPGIIKIACGQSHTVALLDNGSLMSCGNNEYGQLGQEKGSMRPAEIDTLDYWSATDVKCGLSHTVIVTSSGTVLAWGDNSYGQLSFKDVKCVRAARMIELPVPDLPVVQVACGGHHTLVLLKDSRVYSWGSNDHCQLGHSNEESVVYSPKMIANLQSLPIKRITAGGAHNFALSVNGNALGWGRSSYGQLGVFENIVAAPKRFCLKRKIKHIECGEEHSVALTEDGSVFTCGSNAQGQLGRETHEDMTSVPGAVVELMGSEATQIACGKYHTIVLKSSGKMFTFGLNANGELGCSGVSGKSINPCLVEGEWLPHSSLLDLTTTSLSDTGSVVKRIFAGGNQSFATVFIPSHIKINEKEDCPLPFDHGMTCSIETPMFLSYESLKEILDATLIRKSYDSAVKILEMFFSSPSCVNGSFLGSGYQTMDNCIGIDLDEIQNVYQLLKVRLCHLGFDKKLDHALFKELLSCMPNSIPCYECLRVYCFLLCHPSMKAFPDCMPILVPFIQVFLMVGEKEKEIISDWLFERPKEFILSWIEIFRNPIEQILEIGQSSILESKHSVVYLTSDQTWALQDGIKLLKWLYLANMKHSEPISYKKFYVNNVADFSNLQEDYLAFMQKKVDRVVFSRYWFVLNEGAKAEVLQADSQIMKSSAQAQAQAEIFMNTFIQGMSQPPYQQQSGEIRQPENRPLQVQPIHRNPIHVNAHFCVIIVQREKILYDALTQLLSKNERELQKPLMVKFVGEEGLDEGGVTKEFFMLLMKEILNPVYGLFYEEDESRLIWFKEQPDDLLQEDLKHFFLVGMICGLAIYNGVNLDLPFPLVLYKKLLGGTGLHVPNLQDLAILKPSVGKHLNDMLKLDESSFKEAFTDLTFEITRFYFGKTLVVPLVPGGSNVHVEEGNRKKYVDCYVEYELVESVKKQFDAFFAGFRRVYNTTCEIFKYLHPEELQSFIVGSNTYNFNEIRAHTGYLNGYDSNHPSIKIFWEVTTNLPQEAKKKLLIFWSGSDRIPITGIKNMRLRIQRMDAGIHNSKLPVAHTCSNVLDLPPYPTADIMKEKLLKAVYFTTGFGIV